jgi:hypothetical protein
MNYTQAKLQQLNAISTYRIYGHPIDFDNDTGDEGVARRGWRPVRPCLCVHDSPQNPCPCDKTFVWWLSEEAIIQKGASGRKDERGGEVQYFDVLVESNIMVESVHSVRAGTLKKLESSPSFMRFRDLVATTEGLSEPRVNFILGKIVDAIIGWAVGNLLDNIRVSDWLEELLEEEKKKKQEQGK